MSTFISILSYSVGITISIIILILLIKTLTLITIHLRKHEDSREIMKGIIRDIIAISFTVLVILSIVFIAIYLANNP